MPNQLEVGVPLNSSKITYKIVAGSKKLMNFAEIIWKLIKYRFNR